MASIRKKKNPAVEAALGNPLYCRTNGFLLGCFLGLIRYRFASDKFHLHRARILQFFAEIELDVPLPASWKRYSADADSLMQVVIARCAGKSKVLGNFALLSTMASIDAVLRLAGQPDNGDLRTECHRILNEQGLDAPALYDRMLARVRHLANDAGDGPDGVHLQTILTPMMEMLSTIIEQTANDTSTCFVAMPFKAPYSRFWGQFYQPLAVALDCSAFRMWGGLSGEAYVELMLAIMRHCKIVIADLSGANANVMYEFGVARGLQKKVVPLCRKRLGNALPSNIASDQLLQTYSPREKDWPFLVVQRCAAQVAMMDLTRELMEDSLGKSSWVEGEALPHIPEFGEPKAGAVD